MSEKYTPRSDNPWDKEKEEEKKHWFSRIGLSNYAEPAVIIALISALFYIFISAYYISYFQRLSIPFYTLDLSLTFYLYAAKQILISIFFLILIFFVVDTTSILEKDFLKGKNYKNFFGLIICYSTLILGYIYLLGLLKTGNILYILFPPIFYIIYVKSFKNRVLDRIGFVMVNFFLIYAIIFVYIPILGSNYAENLIKGNEGNLEIELELKDNESSLPNGTLILVTHTNNKYFLVERNESDLEDTTLYIIPDDQIKMITVKPVEKEQGKFYEFL